MKVGLNSLVTEALILPIIVLEGVGLGSLNSVYFTRYFVSFQYDELEKVSKVKDKYSSTGFK